MKRNISQRLPKVLVMGMPDETDYGLLHIARQGQLRRPAPPEPEGGDGEPLLEQGRRPARSQGRRSEARAAKTQGLKAQSHTSLNRCAL
jgi:hypothetical protein